MAPHAINKASIWTAISAIVGLVVVTLSAGAKSNMVEEHERRICAIEERVEKSVVIQSEIANDIKWIRATIENLTKKHEQ